MLLTMLEYIFNRGRPTYADVRRIRAKVKLWCQRCDRLAMSYHPGQCTSDGGVELPPVNGRSCHP